MTAQNRRIPTAALIVAALTFGLAYPIVKEATATGDPMSFVAWRFLIGAVGLLALSFPTQSRVWRDGTIGGIWLFAGYSLQALALQDTEASSAAALTSLLVVLAPLALAARRRVAPSPWAVVAASMGFVGVILITLGEDFGLDRGHVLSLLAASAFAGHLVFMTISAPKHLLVPFAGVQLLVTAVLGFGATLTTGGPTLPTGPRLAAVIGTGLGVSGAAYLVAVWGHGRLGAANSALLLTLVPVGGVVAGVTLSGERLSPQGWLGAIIIVSAAIVVTLRGDDAQMLTAKSVSAGH